MKKEDILRLRDTTEQTRIQFKERVTHDNSEMVAQSNSRISRGSYLILILSNTIQDNSIRNKDVIELWIQKTKTY